MSSKMEFDWLVDENFRHVNSQLLASNFSSSVFVRGAQCKQKYKSYRTINRVCLAVISK